MHDSLFKLSLDEQVFGLSAEQDDKYIYGILSDFLRVTGDIIVHDSHQSSANGRDKPVRSRRGHVHQDATYSDLSGLVFDVFENLFKDIKSLVD
jgi:hypothetical protein